LPPQGVIACRSAFLAVWQSIAEYELKRSSHKDVAVARRTLSHRTLSARNSRPAKNDAPCIFELLFMSWTADSRAVFASIPGCTAGGRHLVLQPLRFGFQSPDASRPPTHIRLRVGLQLVCSLRPDALPPTAPAHRWNCRCRHKTIALHVQPPKSAWSHLNRSLPNVARRDHIARLTALAKSRHRRMQTSRPH
jgi:hypothetical protein